MPPLTPEQLGELPVRLEKLTRTFEETVLDDICRRIAKAGYITDTAEFQIIRLKEMGYANDFIEKAVADYTKKSDEAIKQMFFDAGQVSADFYSEVYKKAGVPFVPLTDNPYMQQFLSAAVSQTKNELSNWTQSMGFSVIENGQRVFKPTAKIYQEVLDLTQMQVANGVFDYNTAVRNAVKKLTDSGLRYVDYATGWVNHADVAVRRACLTGLNQLSSKVSEQVAKELDTDVVEVTAHAGARPEHAVWQGKWYSLSGKDKRYPMLSRATGYGTGAGLCGWNCRHSFYAVVPGISQPAYTQEELDSIDPPPITYNGKTYSYYECTQKQRQMETAMRKTKRDIIGAKGSDDEDMLTAKSVLLRRQQEEYKKFSGEAGLLTQNERTRVYGFSHSEASTAYWKAHKFLSENTKRPITQITDSAINKVKCVKIDGYSDTQNVFIQQEHKRLLSLARSENSHCETAFIISNGNKCEAFEFGSDDRLPFSKPESQNALLYGSNLLVMHNHPRNGGFSATDVHFIFNAEKVKHLTIIKNSGNIEVLTKTDKFNYDSSQTELKRYFKKYVKSGTNAEYNKAISEFLKDNSKQGGMFVWIK